MYRNNQKNDKHTTSCDAALALLLAVWHTKTTNHLKNIFPAQGKSSKSIAKNIKKHKSSKYKKKSMGKCNEEIYICEKDFFAILFSTIFISRACCCNIYFLLCCSNLFYVFPYRVLYFLVRFLCFLQFSYVCLYVSWFLVRYFKKFVFPHKCHTILGLRDWVSQRYASQRITN